MTYQTKIVKRGFEFLGETIPSDANCLEFVVRKKGQSVRYQTPAGTTISPLFGFSFSRPVEASDQPLIDYFVERISGELMLWSRQNFMRALPSSSATPLPAAASSN